ncbi:hypothetical protein ACE3MZ_04520 [Paenibacillus sp. WLX1005]|uniref:hypothetical protein n=1 Tax=Paenibacillus sp. WLX1005 TaxID=3243766 RepID=UPI0039844170
MKWGMPVMTHTSYFFNRGIWWYAFRQTGWLAALYWVALIMVLPFRLINKENNINTINAGVSTVNHLYEYDISGDWQTAVLIVFPCLIAVFLTRYMQHRKSNDLFHSLPVKRHHLLSVHLIVGMIMLSVPVWLTGLILWLMRFSLKHIYFGNVQIIEWIVSTNVIMLLLFSFTMLIGICVGQSILQLIVTGGLLYLPSVLSNLFDLHFKMFLYGYVGNNIFHDSPAFWSPIYRISNLNYWALEAREGWMYVLWSILFVLLSYWLYRMRPAESASVSIVFRYFNPLFQFGMTLTISLMIGILCKSLIVSKPVIVIGGYIIGAIIGSIVADMIIRRTWQIADKYMLKQLSIYGVLTLLVLFFSVSSLNGFASRVPEENNIQSVFVGSDLQMDLYSFERATNGTNISQQLNSNVFSNDHSYIEAVIDLHRILEQMRPNENVSEQDIYHLGNDQQYIQIAYQLKDGDLLTRKYSFSFDEYKAYILPVINQFSYKRSYYSLDELESYSENIQVVNPDLVRTANNNGLSLLSIIQKKSKNLKH